jgi:hypothetical protein
MKRLSGSIHDTIYGVLELKENETVEEYFQRIDDFGYALEASILEGNTQEKFGLKESEAGRLSIASDYIVLRLAYGQPCFCSGCQPKTAAVMN